MGGKPDNELDAMKTVHETLAGLDDGARIRVLNWVLESLEIVLGGRTGQSVADLLNNAPAEPSGSFVRSVVPGVKEFVLEKKPENDSERVAVLGYYLTHFRGTPEFKTREITLLNREAKQPPIGNAARAVNNATQQSRYLAPTSGGKKQLSTRGEALVECLPDRVRVKDALAEQPAPRKRKKAGKKKVVGAIG